MDCADVGWWLGGLSGCDGGGTKSAGEGECRGEYGMGRAVLCWHTKVCALTR